MTIDELGTQMKQIDPNLELYFYKDYKVPDHISYEEDGVEHVLYEFLKNEFDKYECSKTISPFQFIKLQNLISDFFDDTYSQTISKEKTAMENKLLFFAVCFVVSIIFLAVLFLAIYAWDQLNNWLERFTPNWLLRVSDLLILALIIAIYMFSQSGDKF